MNAREVYNEWVQSPYIDEETRAELLAIADNDGEIEDRFWQELEFGTAGLRGIMGAGTNRMNKYIVARATQGLADYINQQYRDGLTFEGRKIEKSVTIACDSRNMSEEFCRNVAAVLNANGIKTYVFDRLRPTPELSFAIRHLNCISGVNVTASHNPPAYNGYKVYWADGAQITEPNDTGIMKCVGRVANLFTPKMMDRQTAEKAGLYVEIGSEIDNLYIDTILAEIKCPEAIWKAGKDVKITYTPLHGAGIMIVPEALKRAGFEQVSVVPEQAEPDGDFPTVDYPNPEIPSAFALADKLGEETGADIIIATDPDADRFGIHVRDLEGNYHALDGNLIGAVMCEYELARRSEKGKIPGNGYVIRSIVTSRLTDAIAASYGVRVVSVLTGFKNIGRAMLDIGQKGTYLYGFEESNGYLTGGYARDKDGCGTALVFSEIAAYYKSKGLSVWDAVLELYAKYGFYKERTISIVKEGIEGSRQIREDMENFRKMPPEAFGRAQVIETTDYLDSEKTGLPASNVLIWTLDCGWVAVRPSGTEPKIKYYVGVSGRTALEAEEKLEEICAELV